MNKETFDKYRNNLLRKAADKRREKEKEYFSTEDSLASFRRVASFRGAPTPSTIMDLGSKSLESISSMVNNEFYPPKPLSDEIPTLEQWDEKFVDAINYLLKLYASVREERGE